MTNPTAALSTTRGMVHSVETFGTVDGPGIRYVLFLQGCPLRCLYCHNPDSQSCHGGRLVTAGKAVEDIQRYRGYIRSGGVTFSGGEPLGQPQFVEATATLLREEGIHTAIDTSGSEDPSSPTVKAAIDAADLLLLDIKAADSETAKRLTGRGNENAFATLDACEAVQKPVWVRHVLLHGYTLDEKELTLLAQKLAGYTCIQKLELLPFHKLGEEKWRAMERHYTLWDTPATTKAEAKWAAGFFAQAPYEVIAT